MRTGAGTRSGRRRLTAAAVAWIACCLVVPAGARGEEPPPPGARDSIPSDRAVEVFGFFQIDYRRAAKADTATSPLHEWNARRARLGVTGRVAKRVRYTLIAQGDGLVSYSASFIDAYADFEAAPWLTFRVGQYKYDFDIEARESDAETPMIDRPFVTNAVAGSLNGASTASVQTSNARDRGLALRGKATSGGATIRGAVGLYQGTGRASDNNSDFSVAGRISAEALRGVGAGVGYLFSPNRPRGTPGTDEYSAWTAGGTYDRGRWFARAEVYRAERDRGAGKERIDGFYAVGSLTACRDLDLTARVQLLTDERFPSGANDARSTDFGARWYFARRDRRGGTSLVVNAMFRDADPGFEEGITLLNDGRGPAIRDGSLVGTVVLARAQVAF